MNKPAPISFEISELPLVGEFPAIEDLFRLARRRGLRINNLFHRMDGQWQCNLRSADATSFFEFAVGVPAAEAVIKALKKVEANRVVPVKRGPDEDLDPRTTGLTRTDPDFILATGVNGDTTESDADADDDLIG